jgi:hypothetical protein
MTALQGSATYQSTASLTLPTASIGNLRPIPDGPSITAGAPQPTTADPSAAPRTPAAPSSASSGPSSGDPPNLAIIRSDKDETRTDSAPSKAPHIGHIRAQQQAMDHPVGATGGDICSRYRCIAEIVQDRARPRKGRPRAVRRGTHVAPSAMSAYAGQRREVLTRDTRGIREVTSSGRATRGAPGKEFTDLQPSPYIPDSPAKPAATATATAALPHATRSKHLQLATAQHS